MWKMVKPRHLGANGQHAATSHQPISPVTTVLAHDRVERAGREQGWIKKYNNNQITFTATRTTTTVRTTATPSTTTMTTADTTAMATTNSQVISPLD